MEIGTGSVIKYILIFMGCGKSHLAETKVIPVVELSYVDNVYSLIVLGKVVHQGDSNSKPEIDDSEQDGSR